MNVLSLRSHLGPARLTLVLAVLAALTLGVPGIASAAAPRAERWHLSWSEGGSTIHVWVRPNHAKTILICDPTSDSGRPALAVDPSGPKPPIYYFDSGGDGRCFTRTIGYSVRKMRIGVQNTWYSWPNIWWRGDWVARPTLPYPDF